MMKKLMALLVLLILCSRPAYMQELNQQANDTFRMGVTLYSSGNFSGALNTWLSLYNSGFRSARLDYNIGNAYFKLNNFPGAILFFERALLLKPADEDIIYNLQIARTMVVDKLAELPELFFVSWYCFISLILPANTWAVISLFTFIFFLVFLSLYLYSSGYRLKVAGFWLSVILLTVSLLSLSLSYENKKHVYNNNGAIVFCPQVQGKSSPDSSGTDLFLIHEGTKVKIEDNLGKWFEIRLSDGNKGWVPEECLTRI